ncbi:Ku protein [Flavipsychrobacter stenotrophus]|uniref:Non-homologous end joining protein Ku n=1 Tax=Flavipsychrobacter stenotrophus TaxID=2077091 RepID=A0A2S7SPJ8_9BACT|nr:Ku protein [Flavipsychrobacter stenotrophus]PQJ08822.1 Ku protein [Flavipsychrobacter stenotrophus]
MRPLWTGAIGFGLVNIPVKLYSAIQSSNLDLDMLDKKDNAHIKFKRVNENTGKEVAWGNIVKGYMVKDKYVILDDKDFEQANAKKSQLIEIGEFVDEGEIDTLLFEMPYYLGPAKGGEKAYGLLRAALEKSGKVGVATFVLRNKEHLCILKAGVDIIQLVRLRFGEEIRSTEELAPKSAVLKPAELKMAISLIDQLSGKFDVGRYKDTYSGELMKVIKSKAKGVKPKEHAIKIVNSKSKDLMAQLKASLEIKMKKAS